MVQTIVALVVFLFPLAYSPGPGNMFFAANGARFGFLATIPANVGYHLATWIVTAAIGFGFVAAIDQFPHLFLALKTAGSLYVLWIAWKLFKAGVFDSNQEVRPASLLDGVILLILNPKAYVIIALMFTQFINPTDPGQWMGVLIITTVFTVNNLVAFTLWTLIGDQIAGLFRSPESARKLNMIFGVILALVGVWM
ncbi:MAG: LysE family translocator, partial [Pseudomonadota bacterium]